MGLKISMGKIWGWWGWGEREGERERERERQRERRIQQGEHNFIDLTNNKSKRHKNVRCNFGHSYDFVAVCGYRERWNKQARKEG